MHVIEYVDGHVEGFAPELLLDAQFRQVGSDHCESCMVELFSNAVELGCV